LLRIVFSLFLLILIFSQVDLTQVLRVVGNADPALILLSMAALQIGVLIRTFRWWYLSHEPVPLRHNLRLVYMGDFVSSALPTGYAGDLARIIEYKGSGARAATAGVVLLDRVLGLSGMLLVALVGSLLGRGSLPPQIVTGVVSLSAAGLLLIGIILPGWLPNLLVLRLPQRFTKLREAWLLPLIEAFSSRRRWDLAIGLSLSVLNTVSSVLNHYAVARAVGVPLNLPLYFIFAPIVNLSLLLPAINGLGLREIGYQVLLTPLGIKPDVAVALGLGLFVSRLSNTLIGAISHMLWTIRHERRSESDLSKSG
jgi:uncharacterized membrane protein YbhN (UPF0104 family)